MKEKLGQLIRRLRTEKGMSQQQLADSLFVDRSSVARWETGARVPETMILPRLARNLGVDPGVLIAAAEDPEEKPCVIIVDDESILLNGGLAVIRETLPKAAVRGFYGPSGALAWAREHDVALAFLDIELGTRSGLDLCRELLKINPRTNVVYLTAHMGYALDAWDTGASGFMPKPVTPEAIRKELGRLKHPVGGLSML